MSEAFAELTSRVATLTSISRTRKADDRRRSVNGGELVDLKVRVQEFVDSQRVALDELEKATAP